MKVPLRAPWQVQSFHFSENRAEQIRALNFSDSISDLYQHILRPIQCLRAAGYLNCPTWRARSEICTFPDMVGGEDVDLDLV